ncbi:HAD family hydrolase [Oleiharenicola lentus]|uniref:HAD family hydrolase n=1 Tax=Oleiharenicola lentus TaxID=2508720 RepID=UPI003F665797
MRFRTVLFDLDGTLIDHFKAIHRCHAFAMQQIGLPAPTYQQVFNAVGGGLDEAIAKLAGVENVERILPIYTKHWLETNLQDVEILPGAREILQQLNAAGVRCGVLTNKRGPAARQVCDFLGFTPLLDGIFGAGDVPWIKPDPRFAQHALAALGADAATSALVGDSPWDFKAAVGAGLAFYGVTTGTHTAEELRAAGAKPESIFANLAEVDAALR